MISFNLILVL